MSDKYFVNAGKTECHVIDEDFTNYLPDGLTEISKDEYDAIVAKSLEKTDEHKLADFKADVQAALYASDLVALRAYKAGVAFGPEWAKYDADLRKLKAITVFSEDLSLPPKPTVYPS